MRNGLLSVQPVQNPGRMLSLGGTSCGCGSVQAQHSTFHSIHVVSLRCLRCSQVLAYKDNGVTSRDGPLVTMIFIVIAQPTYERR